jgi:hypothetical protein
MAPFTATALRGSGVAWGHVGRGTHGAKPAGPLAAHWLLLRPGPEKNQKTPRVLTDLGQLGHGVRLRRPLLCCLQCWAGAEVGVARTGGHRQTFHKRSIATVDFMKLQWYARTTKNID